MSKSRNSIDRRSFLKVSSLAGGGMLIGFNFFTACRKEAELPVKEIIDVSKLKFIDFNAFIKISKDNIVSIIAPNPEIGQGVKTSMPMIIAEELCVNWDNVHVVQGGLDTDVFDRQVAGGSQSIRHGWDALRETGATVRQMLVNAAAKKWQTDPEKCKADKGVISNDKGEKISFGEIAAEAAKLEVPKDVNLKDPKDFTIIGTDIGNVDIDEIISGKPLFGLDYRKEGMLYATVMRPPAFGQKLVSFDDSRAKKQDGVVDIFKFDNKIAVLAKTIWQAIRAKKDLKAKWKSDSKLESTEDMDQTLNDLLNGKNFKTMRSDGNIKKAFAEADQILERVYEAPVIPHNCLEPMNFFADVTDDKIELAGPIQTPAGTAKQISKILKRDLKDIKLDMTRMGGGFGRRLYGDFAVEAALISDKIRKPVLVVFTREDDMEDGIYRPASKYKFRAAIKNDKIIGYHLTEAAMNSNMYGLIPNFFPAGSIENYQVDVAHYKSHITTGAWRAPYTNFLAFAEQSFFDELAEVMKVDKIQLRLDLLEKAKGNKDERMQYSPERMQKVITTCVEKANFGKERSGVYQGFSAYYCHNTHVAEVADVVMEDGAPVVKKITCVIDCGIVVNPLGAKNQVEGGVIDGIGHAMYGELRFDGGAPQSSNFDTYRLIRMNETPEVETYFIENEISPTGLGEPALPPASGAVANAIKAATGFRMTKQPFIQYKEVFERELTGSQ